MDEVKAENRAACVEAINRYAKEVGLPGIVVCCRLEQYEELKVKLTLNGAIYLRPLTDTQIDKYVEQAGAELTGLRNALRQDSVLQELARAPLMLNLMCAAYRGYGAQDLAGRETPENRSRHLFTTYIDHIFKTRGKAALAYPRERSLDGLSWIARRLSERNQTMFLIEALQPSWLSSGAQRWAYLAGFSLVLGLLVGFANMAYWWTSPTAPNGLAYREIIAWLTAMPLWFLAFGWIEGLGSGSGRPVLERVPPGAWRAGMKALLSAVLWLLVAPAALAVFTWWEQGQITWWVHEQNNVPLQHLLWSGVAFVLVLGAKGRDRSISYSIETVESLRWSPANAWQGALLGLLGGLVVGGSVFVLKERLPAGELGWIGDLRWIYLVGFGTVGLGLGGIFGGLKPRVVEEKTVPNQGMRLSGKTAVFWGGVSAVVLGLIVIAFAWLSEHTYNCGEGIGCKSLAAAGWVSALFTVVFLWFGGFDVLKHYVLRAVLGASGQVPWNLPRFLDQARDLNLMQSVGSAYIFVHRRLLEHLAASEQER